MSVQVFCKTKEVVIRQSLLPAVIFCKSSQVPASSQQGRRSRLPRYTSQKQLPRLTPPFPLPEVPLLQDVIFPLSEGPLLKHVPYSVPEVSMLNFNSSTEFPVLISEENVLLFSGGSEEKPDQEKVMNLSRMYDNIIREIPRLLDNHDYTIYAHDLEFVSHLPILRTVHGRQSYKVSLMTWFSSLKLLYTDLYIDMMSSEKDNNCVSVRWGICGNARINSSYTRLFDGTSTFYPEHGSGLIKVHVLDKVALNKWGEYHYNHAPL